MMISNGINCQHAVPGSPGTFFHSFESDGDIMQQKVLHHFSFWHKFLDNNNKKHEDE